MGEYKRRPAGGLLHSQRSLGCAAALDGRYLPFHGGRNMGMTDTPERWERKCGAYRRLCSIASSCGITLAQENVAWCRSRDPVFLAALYRDVPELRYTLDIKQAYRAGRNWKEFVDTVGDRIVNVHINDFSAEQSCLVPGAGCMDYADFFSALRRVGYDGHALIEVYRSNFASEGELARAVKLLSRFAAV